MDGFSRRMKKVTSAGKFIGIPAAIVAGWMAAVAMVVSELATPVPLEASVEKVLAASVEQNAPERLPTSSPAVAAHPHRSGNAG